MSLSSSGSTDRAVPDRLADDQPDGSQPERTEPERTDAQRLDDLWNAYSRRIQAYASRHVDPDTAAEVVSETFLIAWRRLADVPGNPLPWLLVVARNTIRNQHRSTYRARSLTTELARIAVVTRPVAEAAEDVALEREALLRGLAALSTKEREALLLTAWDGLSATEAALVAGCSVSAFQVRLHRARKRLTAVVDGGALARRGTTTVRPGATTAPTETSPTTTEVER